MDSWHSYPKIYALGHRGIRDLFLDEVVIEEKVDGSQFSFGKFALVDGLTELRLKSKGATILEVAPPAMFKAAVETVKGLPLREGWTYRGEVLAKPKHNSLAYDRVPRGNVIIFDINTGEEAYLSYEEKLAECERLGLECVPLLFQGKIVDVEGLRVHLERTSVLGGAKIEGMVIKNYHRFGVDGKALLGKFVSEAFKEIHRKEWKESNPTQNDILVRLTETFKTPARWQKAVVHLKEQGLLEDSPRDIGKLIKEVHKDILEECQQEIQELLLAWALPHLKRSLIGGLPEWYKEQLMEKQFEQGASHDGSSDCNGDV